MTQHIHFIGICGTGMGSLAGLCKASGCHVTGSDERVYPPMSTQLATLGIRIEEGYKPEHLVPRPDMVVIGNVITKTNTEAQAAIAQEIPYRSMPDALAESFLGSRYPIVIAGTHGKTTTASIAAWLLEHSGRAPGFLIGGIPVNFGISCRVGSGKEFVVEGDEYDTAFFDKTPKFLHYMPQAAVLGPIEFDHADIYKDMFAVMSAFRKFVEQIPSSGLLAACNDSENVRSLLPHAKCRIITYAVSAAADYQATSISLGPDGARCSLAKNGSWSEYRSPMAGRHNLQNALGVLALLSELGLPAGSLQDGMMKFAGVKRRQEVRGTANGVTVIDDFAHHPTAVKETIAAICAKYPAASVWVAFEPRSNTTRRNIFQQELAEAFGGAHEVAIAPLFMPEKIPDGERLDLQRLVSSITAGGTPARAYEHVDKIVEVFAKAATSGDVIVCMSNGGFGEIHEKLLHQLGKK